MKIGIPDFLISTVNALKTTTIQEDLFIQGKSFSYEEYLSYSTDETKTFVFDATAYTGGNLVFNPIAFSASSGPILVKFYYGTTANDDGTLLGVSNRRATSTIVNKGIWRLNPTGVTLGTEFASDMVPSNAAIGQTSTGNGNQPGLPFEINPVIKYALTLTNTDGDSTYVQMKATWFEP